MNKINFDNQVGVTSRAFSQNPVLRAELDRVFSGVRYNDTGRQLTSQELVAFLDGCSAAIVSLEKISRNVLDQLPDLKVISKYGVGLDNIDLAALKERKILFGWQGGLNKRSVAELALSMILLGVRRSYEANCHLREGRWQPLVGKQLTGKTVGIVGCGHVGKELIRLLQPFQCQLLSYDIQDFGEFYREHHVRPVTLEELLAQGDVVSLHVPLTARTRDLINENNISLLKPNAVLINTARGGIVNEASLIQRLKKRDLHCGFDVFEVEPPRDPELLRYPTFFATPHIGGSSSEAQWTMGESAIKGLLEPMTIETMAERKLLPVVE